MSDPKDYTVGWICAISTEHVAAQAFLDEKHGGPEYVSPNDTNNYTLGKIGEHNVVIAVLPDGEYGISSAAGVAKDMLHSFPNVRIGLMVGIGGGAPSPKHDIRLGDIVVSAPRDGEVGVFQYDFGKTIQDQKFRPTGVLNQPPTALRTAVSGLKSDYEIEGHRLEEAIYGILEKKPRLRKKYKRPDPGSDKLYRSGFIHTLDNEASCAVVCGDDPSHLILRHERAEGEDNPAIHYGLIASANQLIKDASIRDRLAAEKDVLCFEMEAAGLMNHFPCLVIRGICNYADSHNNKDWEGYAAMTAAAYAKDLLSKITLNRVDAEKRISEILPVVLDTVSRTGANVEVMSSRLTEKEDFEVLDWLTQVDYGPQQSDYIRRRQPGTGQWLLESAEYRDWLKSNKQTLFCPGIPGAGKTTLTAVVINDLTMKCHTNETIGLAYIYCNFWRKDEQKAEDLLASILKQLAQCQSSLPESVKELYKRHKNRRTWPSLDELLGALQFVVIAYSRVFFVVDALDECQASDGCRKVFLSQLFDLQKKCPVNIFATARPIPEITQKFNGLTLEIHAHESDVRKYLEGRISQTESKILKEHEEEIKSRITEVVDGMFLLAQLHFNSIETNKTFKKVKKTLQNLSAGPEAYTKAYEDAMGRIKGQDADALDLAMGVLLWITCAKRQLTTLELQHALAVEQGAPELDKDNIPQVEDMVSVCSGLVVVDEESNIIRLVHYTTKEYFETRKKYWFPDAELNLSMTCVTYLSFNTFESGTCLTYVELEARLQQNPLYDYAARNWGYHAREAYPEVKDLTARFLQGPTLVSAVQVLVAQRFHFGTFDIPKGIMGLHIAAYFGMNEGVMEFLRVTVCPDLADGYGQTALHWAVRNEQQQTVELLLNEGFNVNANDTETRSALHYAASQNNKMLIQLLLKYGAKIEAQDICGQTPLLVAAGDIKVEAVIELLFQGATVNALDAKHRNALHLAIIASRAESTLIADMLLSHSIDFSVCDVGNMTPLHYAVGTGSCEIIDSLLKAGADVNMGIERKHWTRTVESGRPVYRERRVSEAGKQKINDAVGLTPLHFAACIGYNAMTEYLLSKGADPNARCHNGETPLHIALRGRLFESQNHLFRCALSDHDEWTYEGWRIEFNTEYITDYEGEEAREIYQYIEEGRLAVINTLLASTGINVNIQNIEHGSPLHMVKYDHCNAHAIVCKLLELGADIFARYNGDRTALHLACKWGASTIACDFLDRGCSIKTTDLQGLNALHYAVRADQHDTVRMILDRDEQLAQSLCRDVDARGRTLVHHHLEEGMKCSIEMLTVLLCHGSRLNDVDQDGNTPLSLYLQGFTWLGQIKICRFLLKHGADALWRSPKGQNLAHLAMCGPVAELGVLEALSNHGVDVAAKDTSGKSIVHYGAIHGTLSKEILNFIQRNNLLHLDDEDAQGKNIIYVCRRRS